MARRKTQEIHHWQGLEPDPSKFFGFVYLVTNKQDGRKYIGRKNFWLRDSKPGTKTVKTTNRQSQHWKPAAWKESDWRTYTGSSKELSKDIDKYGKDNFTFEILKQCRSRGSLVYSEVEHQVKLGCLWKKNDDTYQFYNRQIAAIRFRPPSDFQTAFEEDSSHE
jgi:hypothetical protein